MNILVDANILVRLRDAASSQHIPCAEAVQRVEFCLPYARSSLRRPADKKKRSA